MKIHETTEDINKEEKKPHYNESKYQSIERKYHPYDKLSDVIQNEYKGFKGSTFTVRTSKELDNSLRVYSETHNIPISESIKTILEKYFEHRFVARTFFRLEKPFTVAIPLTLSEIEKYIDDEIDCRIELSSDIDSRLAVQRQKISKDETDYYLAVSFNVGNNYLDTYDDERETYVSGTYHHIGLFDIYLEHLQESVFLQVVYEEKTPISAKIITKEMAVKYAVNVDNKLLIEYLKNIEQANAIQDFKTSIAERETYILTLEARIKSLENELAKFTFEEHDEQDELNEENVPRDQQNSTKYLIPKETQKQLADAMLQIMKMQDTYAKVGKTITDMMIKAEIANRQLENALNPIGNNVDDETEPDNAQDE